MTDKQENNTHADLLEGIQGAEDGVEIGAVKCQTHHIIHGFARACFPVWLYNSLPEAVKCASRLELYVVIQSQFDSATQPVPSWGNRDSHEIHGLLCRKDDKSWKALDVQ